MVRHRLRPAQSLCALSFLSLLAACSQSTAALDSVTTSSVKPYAYTAKDKECLARAMFFESNRSSREGLVAVGTVVMNRLESGDYPETICGVVGQKNQFAPGVLSRPMNSKALPDVLAAAEAVLEGERHPEVKEAKFFHQAGLTFPYKNMHYVLEAGGNAFYEKRSRRSKAAETEVASQKPAASGAVLSYGAGVEASAAAGMLDHVLPKEAPVPSRLPGA